LSYQIAADFADATTAYNSTAGKWELTVHGLGAEFIALLLDKNGTDLSEPDGVTYDTLKAWMIGGMEEYQSTLQTNWPDPTPFHSAGGKVIHFHGEADSSIPTASSVRYWESVRSIMYPDLSYQGGADALKDWYRLFLILERHTAGPTMRCPTGHSRRRTFRFLSTGLKWVLRLSLGTQPSLRANTKARTSKFALGP
jgi:tannase